ncbi:hypothetical protein [Microcoleus sp. bin38.metabat.b11b12b14.051]|uniref:hypothetical protein n=1 Tax=Microcoleus sp. bin38.metabat.b11b12b14.051 TaxID=2742709 RepID=UPI0025E5A808|nr:hypothetical protein [Microcoleus sp. bin38.metabat.b11b12b14.051]
MAGNNVYMGSGNSGNYNESIQGNYIQGNCINIDRDSSQAAAKIQQLLIKLQTEGYTPQDAQQKIASDLVSQANKDSQFKSWLVDFAHYVSDAGANGLIGEAAVNVVKLALGLLGIPLF